MANELKTGDVVVLKSGGPQMTVNFIEEGSDPPSAYCTWFDKNQTKQSSSFPVASLIKN